MDHLETPYDVEANFIECTVCDKYIRGETLYKIHLTTPGHIKKEDAFVTAGLGVRKNAVPEFKNILQYLDYLKLDEPIVGLNHLEEVPSQDPQAGLRYLCTLCNLNANLQEMVHHVIGRKHRQKYVVVKRPDLVTWDKQSTHSQGGNNIRTRAEIIERQDGRGNPLRVAKGGTDGTLNVSGVPPRQKQNRDQSLAQSFNPPPHFPEHQSYEQDEYSQQNPLPFQPDQSYMNRDRQMFQQRQEGFGREHMGEDYREDNMYRPECNMEPGSNNMEYQEEYVDEGRATHQPRGAPRYDPRQEVPMAQGPPQHVEAAPHRRPYQERDVLKEFYSEEVRRRQARPEYQPPPPPPPPMYPEDKRQWSLDREPGRHDDDRQESDPMEPKRRSFASAGDHDQAHHHLLNIIKDYQHKWREPDAEVVPSHPGPNRARADRTTSISDIPEPFRRFLTGNDEGHGKRKRKSRFSDATAEEVQQTTEIFSGEFGPPNPKFAAHPRAASVPHFPEIPQHYGQYAEPQNPYPTESYREEGLGSRGVFDMLKGVEIENAEEADFLKNKLCNLLKEFKSKKSEKASFIQPGQGGAVHHNNKNNSSSSSNNNHYSRLNPEPQPSLRLQYERSVREDLDLRRSKEQSFSEDSRGRGWKQNDFIPGERVQEYHHSLRRESGYSNRNRYEEAFVRPGMSHTPHATYSDEYRPADEEHFDSRRRDEEPRMMQRGPRYSKNLDKITSTLLELVARK